MSSNCNENLVKWKALAIEPTTLIVGIDISKNKHDACFGTRDSVIDKKFTFGNSLDGFESLVVKIKALILEKSFSTVLLGFEPTGVYWRPLNEYLVTNKFTVCLVDPLTVFHNRKTNHQDKGKSDKKCAFSIFDLISQRKFFFEIEGSKRHFYARILLRNWMNSQDTLIAEKNRMSTNLSLLFPEFEKLVSDITSAKSRNFLLHFPTPCVILKLSLKNFIDKSLAEFKGFNADKLKEIYLTAKRSIGVKLDEESARELLLHNIEHLSSVFDQEEAWFKRCNKIALSDEGYLKIINIKGLGKKIGTGLMLSLGNYRAFSKAKQITKLAGLNLVDKTSGSSIHNPPHISHQGNRDLRYWAFCGALHVIRYPWPFKDMYERKTKGKKKNGSGKKAIIAVSDKLLRIVWTILKKGGEYDPNHDKNNLK